MLSARFPINNGAAVQTSLALASGLLTNLAFEPFGYAAVCFLTLALLFRLWDAASARRAAWLGFAFGVGFYGVGVNWIYISVHDFGSASPILAAAALVLLTCLMSSFAALSGYLQAIIRTPLRWRYLALIPSLWTLTEWLRGWLFTGFPWLYIGYSQTDTWLVGWVPLSGVLGASFTVCIIAGALAALSCGGRLIPIGTAALVLAIGFAGSRIDWTERQHSPIGVAVLQGDVSVIHKWNRRYAAHLLNFFVTASQMNSDADLIIWPEIALPHPDTHLEKIKLWDLLGQHNADFLVGTLEKWDEGNGPQYYNSAFAISGDDIRKYRKSQLVPFGEYTPFRRWLDWLNKFVVLPASDMTAFAGPQSPLLLAGQPAGITICYEDAFSSEVMKMLPTATFLVNISEDAWFGHRLAPHQRLQMSRMRAIETARPVVRAANKGISASIDHRGRVIDSLHQREGKVLRTKIVPTVGTTPFSRYEFLPLVVLCTVLIALSVISHCRRAGQSDQHQRGDA